jgi:aspartate/methionine/tyrosine aminotransferase
MHLLKNSIRSEALLAKTINIKHRFYASSSEPLSHKELIAAAERSGDHALIQAYHDHSLGYADNGGTRDLREEISQLYGANISADNIVVFPGAQTGMTLTAQALLDDGHHAIIITPSYQSLEEGAMLAGCEITRVALSPYDDWQLNIQAVEAAIQPNTKYIALNDPHNPPGALMSYASKQALIALAEKHGILIFSDEVYRLLELDISDRSPSMADLSNNSIALSTMSKPWGAGGTGIGWVVCQDEVICSKLIKAQHIYAVCFSRAGEIQAMMAIRSRDEIINRNMSIIRQNLKLLDGYFAANQELFEWVRPKAGGTGFVKFKGPITATELADRLLEHEILVFPPSIFDCDESLSQYFRIGFSRNTMPAALEAFQRFIDKQSFTDEQLNRSEQA